MRLISVCVYNPTITQDETSAHENIQGFYPPAWSTDLQLNEVGLATAIVAMQDRFSCDVPSVGGGTDRSALLSLSPSGLGAAFAGFGGSPKNPKDNKNVEESTHKQGGSQAVRTLSTSSAKETIRENSKNATTMRAPDEGLHTAPLGSRATIKSAQHIKRRRVSIRCGNSEGKESSSDFSEADGEEEMIDNPKSRGNSQIEPTTNTGNMCTRSGEAAEEQSPPRLSELEKRREREIQRLRISSSSTTAVQTITTKEKTSPSSNSKRYPEKAKGRDQTEKSSRTTGFSSTETEDFEEERRSSSLLKGFGVLSGILGSTFPSDQEKLGMAIGKRVAAAAAHEKEVRIRDEEKLPHASRGLGAAEAMCSDHRASPSTCTATSSSFNSLRRSFTTGTKRWVVVPVEKDFYVLVSVARGPEGTLAAAAKGEKEWSKKKKGVGGTSTAGLSSGAASPPISAATAVPLIHPLEDDADDSIDDAIESYVRCYYRIFCMMFGSLTLNYTKTVRPLTKAMLRAMPSKEAKAVAKAIREEEMAIFRDLVEHGFLGKLVPELRDWLLQQRVDGSSFIAPIGMELLSISGPASLCMSSIIGVLHNAHPGALKGVVAMCDGCVFHSSISAEDTETLYRLVDYYSNHAPTTSTFSQHRASHKAMWGGSGATMAGTGRQQSGSEGRGGSEATLSYHSSVDRRANRRPVGGGQGLGALNASGSTVTARSNSFRVAGDDGGGGVTAVGGGGMGGRCGSTASMAISESNPTSPTTAAAAAAAAADPRVGCTDDKSVSLSPSNSSNAFLTSANKYEGAKAGRDANRLERTSARPPQAPEHHQQHQSLAMQTLTPVDSLPTSLGGKSGATTASGDSGTTGAMHRTRSNLLILSGYNTSLKHSKNTTKNKAHPPPPQQLRMADQSSKGTVGGNPDDPDPSRVISPRGSERVVDQDGNTEKEGIDNNTKGSENDHQRDAFFSDEEGGGGFGDEHGADAEREEENEEGEDYSTRRVDLVAASSSHTDAHHDDDRYGSLKVLASEGTRSSAFRIGRARVGSFARRTPPPQPQLPSLAPESAPASSSWLVVGPNGVGLGRSADGFSTQASTSRGTLPPSRPRSPQPQPQPPSTTPANVQLDGFTSTPTASPSCSPSPPRPFGTARGGLKSMRLNGAYGVADSDTNNLLTPTAAASGYIEADGEEEEEGSYIFIDDVAVGVLTLEIGPIQLLFLVHEKYLVVPQLLQGLKASIERVLGLINGEQQLLQFVLPSISDSREFDQTYLYHYTNSMNLSTKSSMRNVLLADVSEQMLAISIQTQGFAGNTAAMASSLYQRNTTTTPTPSSSLIGGNQRGGNASGGLRGSLLFGGGNSSRDRDGGRISALFSTSASSHASSTLYFGGGANKASSLGLLGQPSSSSFTLRGSASYYGYTPTLGEGDARKKGRLPLSPSFILGNGSSSSSSTRFNANTSFLTTASSSVSSRTAVAHDKKAAKEGKAFEQWRQSVRFDALAEELSGASHGGGAWGGGGGQGESSGGGGGGSDTTGGDNSGGTGVRKPKRAVPVRMPLLHGSHPSLGQMDLLRAFMNPPSPPSFASTSTGSSRRRRDGCSDRCGVDSFVGLGLGLAPYVSDFLPFPYTGAPPNSHSSSRYSLSHSAQYLAFLSSFSSTRLGAAGLAALTQQYVSLVGQPHANYAPSNTTGNNNIFSPNSHSPHPPHCYPSLSFLAGHGHLRGGDGIHVGGGRVLSPPYHHHDDFHYQNSFGGGVGGHHHHHHHNAFFGFGGYSQTSGAEVGSNDDDSALFGGGGGGGRIRSAICRTAMKTWCCYVSSEWRQFSIILEADTLEEAEEKLEDALDMVFVGIFQDKS